MSWFKIKPPTSPTQDTVPRELLFYITTLDTHEYFGPFQTSVKACTWAWKTERRSFQLSTSLPESAMNQLQQP